MSRFVALTCAFFLIHCSTNADKQSTVDASAEVPDAELPGADAGKDSGYFPGCRPTGVACGDNVSACCSSGCLSTFDMNLVEHTSCD